MNQQFRNPRQQDPEQEATLESLLGGLGTISEDEFNSGTFQDYTYIATLGSGKEGAAQLYEKEGALYVGKHIRLPRNILEATAHGRTLLREANTLNELDHEGISKHLGFLWMPTTRETIAFREYQPGSTIADLIENKPLSESQALEMMEGVAEILAYIHNRAITHRDIKPGNILLREDGKYGILDFGIAKAQGSATTNMGAKGTLEYMAPEQYIEQQIPASDIYGLAITTIHSVLGTLPEAYRNGFVPKVMTKLHTVEQSEEVPVQIQDPKLRELLSDMIRFNPKERIQNGSDLLKKMRASTPQRTYERDLTTQQSTHKVTKRDITLAQENNEQKIRLLEKMIYDWTQFHHPMKVSQTVYAQRTAGTILGGLRRIFGELRPLSQEQRFAEGPYAKAMETAKSIVTAYQQVRQNPSFLSNKKILASQFSVIAAHAAAAGTVLAYSGLQPSPYEITMFATLGGAIGGIGKTALFMQKGKKSQNSLEILKELEPKMTEQLQYFLSEANHIIGPIQPYRNSMDAARAYLQNPLDIQAARLPAPSQRR